MASTAIVNTVTERKRRMKTNKKKIAVIVITVLAVLNLILLIARPDLPLKLFGKSEEKMTEESAKGSGKASLKIKESERTFDGNGTFDPLQGVQAFDTDGSDITGKTAVSYLSGKTISDKEIHYTVFDSDSDKMEAKCKLTLEDYAGPTIHFEEIDKVSWEDLQRLTTVLVRKKLIFGDDGFGNDISNAITYYYEIYPDRAEAEVIFSLVNAFQDYHSEKIAISVEDIPPEMIEE